MSRAVTLPGFPWILLTLALASPSHAAPKAFDVAEEEFFRRVHTIVLMPYSLPSSFDEADSLRERREILEARLDTIFVQTLQEAGIRAIPAREASAAWNRLADSLGGLFDPVSGGRDSAKTAEVTNRMKSEMRARYAPDAWLYPSVQMVSASFDKGYAVWHGAKQKIVEQSGLKGLLFGGDRDTFGHLPALSLFVSIVDMEYQPLYGWGGGLQAMALLRKGRFVDMEAHRIFAERKHSEKAVEKALEKLVKSGRKLQNDKS